MKIFWCGVAAALVMTADPAIAADEANPATCIAKDTNLPAELAAWTSRGDGPIAIGQGRNAMLSPMADVTFTVAPERAADAGTFGAVIKFDVATPGLYRVALGQGAWIDLVKDGKALVSTAHGHGPACSTIRKIVDFDLKPGRYTLQLSGAKAAAMPVMVVKKG